MLRLIAFYQCWISPLFPPRCRFYPSCSSYAADAISQYGTARGGFMAVKRICKCHPLHPGGYDPVPDNQEVITAGSLSDDPSISSHDQAPTHRQNTVNH